MLVILKSSNFRNVLSLIFDSYGMVEYLLEYVSENFCYVAQLHVVDVSLFTKVVQLTVVLPWAFYKKKAHFSDCVGPCCQGLKFRTSHLRTFYDRLPESQCNMNLIFSLQLLYACHYNPLLIRNCSWKLTIHKAKGHST